MDILHHCLTCFSGFLSRLHFHFLHVHHDFLLVCLHLLPSVPEVLWFSSSLPDSFNTKTIFLNLAHCISLFLCDEKLALCFVTCNNTQVAVLQHLEKSKNQLKTMSMVHRQPPFLNRGLYQLCYQTYLEKEIIVLSRAQFLSVVKELVSVSLLFFNNFEHPLDIFFCQRINANQC